MSISGSRILRLVLALILLMGNFSTGVRAYGLQGRFGIWGALISSEQVQLIGPSSANEVAWVWDGFNLGGEGVFVNLYPTASVRDIISKELLGTRLGNRMLKIDVRLKEEAKEAIVSDPQLIDMAEDAVERIDFRCWVEARDGKVVVYDDGAVVKDMDVDVRVEVRGDWEYKDAFARTLKEALERRIRADGLYDEMRKVYTAYLLGQGLKEGVEDGMWLSDLKGRQVRPKDIERHWEREELLRYAGRFYSEGIVGGMVLEGGEVKTVGRPIGGDLFNGLKLIPVSFDVPAMEKVGKEENPEKGNPKKSDTSKGDGEDGEDEVSNAGNYEKVKGYEKLKDIVGEELAKKIASRYPEMVAEIVKIFEEYRKKKWFLDDSDRKKGFSEAVRAMIDSGMLEVFAFTSSKEGDAAFRIRGLKFFLFGVTDLVKESVTMEKMEPDEVISSLRYLLSEEGIGRNMICKIFNYAEQVIEIEFGAKDFMYKLCWLGKDNGKWALDWIRENLPELSPKGWVGLLASEFFYFLKSRPNRLKEVERLKAMMGDKNFSDLMEAYFREVIENRPWRVLLDYLLDLTEKNPDLFDFILSDPELIELILAPDGVMPYVKKGISFRIAIFKLIERFRYNIGYLKNMGLKEGDGYPVAAFMKQTEDLYDIPLPNLMGPRRLLYYIRVCKREESFPIDNGRRWKKWISFSIVSSFFQSFSWINTKDIRFKLALVLTYAIGRKTDIKDITNIKEVVSREILRRENAFRKKMFFSDSFISGLSNININDFPMLLSLSLYEIDLLGEEVPSIDKIWPSIRREKDMHGKGEELVDREYRTPSHEEPAFSDIEEGYLHDMAGLYVYFCLLHPDTLITFPEFAEALDAYMSGKAPDDLPENLWAQASGFFVGVDAALSSRADATEKKALTEEEKELIVRSSQGLYDELISHGFKGVTIRDLVRFNEAMGQVYMDALKAEKLDVDALLTGYILASWQAFGRYARDNERRGLLYKLIARYAESSLGPILDVVRINRLVKENEPLREIDSLVPTPTMVETTIRTSTYKRKVSHQGVLGALEAAVGRLWEVGQVGLWLDIEPDAARQIGEWIKQEEQDKEVLIITGRSDMGIDAFMGMAEEWIDKAIESKARGEDKGYEIVVLNAESLNGEVRSGLHHLLWDRKVSRGSGQAKTVPDNLRVVFVNISGRDIPDEAFMSRIIEEPIYVGEEDARASALIEAIREIANSLGIDEETVGQITSSNLTAMEEVIGQDRDSLSKAAINLLYLGGDREIKKKIEEGHADNLYQLKIIRKANKYWIETAGVRAQMGEQFSEAVDRLKEGDDESSLRDAFKRALMEEEEYALGRQEEVVLSLLLMLYVRAKEAGKREIVELKGPSGEGKSRVVEILGKILGKEVIEETFSKESGSEKVLGRLTASGRLDKGLKIKYEESRILKTEPEDDKIVLLNEINTSPSALEAMEPVVMGLDKRYLYRPDRGDIEERSIGAGLYVYAINPEGTVGRGEIGKARERQMLLIKMEPIERTEKRIENIFTSLGVEITEAEKEALVEVIDRLKEAQEKGKISKRQELTRRQIIRLAKFVREGSDLYRGIELIYGRSWLDRADRQEAQKIIKKALLRGREAHGPPQVESATAEEIRGIISRERAVWVVGDSPGAVGNAIEEALKGYKKIKVVVSDSTGRAELIGGTVPDGKGGVKTAIGALLKAREEAYLTGQPVALRLIGYHRIAPETASQFNETFQKGVIEDIEEIVNETTAKALIKRLERAGKLDKAIEEYLQRKNSRPTEEEIKVTKDTFKTEEEAKGFACWFYSRLGDRVKIVAETVLGSQIRLGAPEIDRFWVVDVGGQLNEDLRSEIHRISQSADIELTQKEVDTVYNHLREAIEIVKRYNQHYRRHRPISEDAVRRIIKWMKEDEKGGLPTEEAIKEAVYIELLSRLPEEELTGSSWEGYGEKIWADAFESANYYPTRAYKKVLSQVIEGYKRGERLFILEGPPSGGKTSYAEEIARQLKLAFYSLPMHEDISRDEAIGGYRLRRGKIEIEGIEVKGDGHIEITNPLLKAYSQGGVYLIDEGALGDNSRRLIEYIVDLLGLEEVDLGQIHPGLWGKKIKRSRDFVLIVSQNPPGVTLSRKELGPAIEERGQGIYVEKDLTLEEIDRMIEFYQDRYLKEALMPLTSGEASLLKMAHHYCQGNHPDKDKIGPRQLREAIKIAMGIKEAQIEGLEGQKAVITAIEISYMGQMTDREKDMYWQALLKGIDKDRADDILKQANNTREKMRSPLTLREAWKLIGKRETATNGEVVFDAGKISEAVRKYLIGLRLGRPIELKGEDWAKEGILERLEEAGLIELERVILTQGSGISDLIGTEMPEMEYDEESGIYHGRLYGDYRYRNGVLLEVIEKAKADPDRLYVIEISGLADIGEEVRGGLNELLNKGEIKVGNKTERLPRNIKITISSREGDELKFSAPMRSRLMDIAVIPSKKEIKERIKAIVPQISEDAAGILAEIAWKTASNTTLKRSGYNIGKILQAADDIRRAIARDEKRGQVKEELYYIMEGLYRAYIMGMNEKERETFKEVIRAGIEGYLRGLGHRDIKVETDKLLSIYQSLIETTMSEIKTKTGKLKEIGGLKVLKSPEQEANAVEIEKVGKRKYIVWTDLIKRIANQVLNAWEEEMPVVLYGPAAGGKSKFIENLSQVIGVPLYRVDINEETGREAIIRQKLSGEGRDIRVEMEIGELIKEACVVGEEWEDIKGEKEGEDENKIVMIDEANTSREMLQFAYNLIKYGREGFIYPYNGKNLRVRLKRGVRIALAYNRNGAGYERHEIKELEEDSAVIYMPSPMEVYTEEEMRQILLKIWGAEREEEVSRKMEAVRGAFAAEREDIEGVSFKEDDLILQILRAYADKTERIDEEILDEEQSEEIIEQIREIYKMPAEKIIENSPLRDKVEGESVEREDIIRWVETILGPYLLKQSMGERDDRLSQRVIKEADLISPAFAEIIEAIEKNIRQSNWEEVWSLLPGIEREMIKKGVFVHAVELKVDGVKGSYIYVRAYREENLEALSELFGKEALKAMGIDEDVVQAIAKCPALLVEGYDMASPGALAFFDNIAAVILKEPMEKQVAKLMDELGIDEDTAKKEYIKLTLAHEVLGHYLDEVLYPELPGNIEINSMLTPLIVADYPVHYLKKLAGYLDREKKDAYREAADVIFRALYGEVNKSGDMAKAWDLDKNRALKFVGASKERGMTAKELNELAAKIYRKRLHWKYASDGYYLQYAEVGRGEGGIGAGIVTAPAKHKVRVKVRVKEGQNHILKDRSTPITDLPDGIGPRKDEGVIEEIEMTGRRVSLPEVDPALVKRFLNTIGQRSRVEWRGGQDGSEIDVNKLVEGRLDQAFRKRVTKRAEEGAVEVYLTVDISGSTGAIAEQLRDALVGIVSIMATANQMNNGVNLHLSCFGDSFYSMGSLRDELRDREKLEQVVGSIVARIGTEGTDIANAVGVLREQAKGGDAKRKIAIVLTDGDDLSGFDAQEWREFLEEAEREGLLVVMWGFGEESLNVMEGFGYKRYVVQREDIKPADVIEGFMELMLALKDKNTLPEGDIGKEVNIPKALRNENGHKESYTTLETGLPMMSVLEDELGDKKPLQVEEILKRLRRNLGKDRQEVLFEINKAVEYIGDKRINRILNGDYNSPGELFRELSRNELSDAVEETDVYRLLNLLLPEDIDNRDEIIEEVAVELDGKQSWELTGAMARELARRNLTYELVEDDKDETSLLEDRLSALYTALLYWIAREGEPAQEYVFGGFNDATTFEHSPGGLVYYALND